jgi:hypothetical protein
MTYKPVRGYCVLYPEEIKKLASAGLGKRSVYASAPCWAIYLALRQRAWNTRTNWWKTFVSYETLAMDIGWKWDLSAKKSIERALGDLQEMGMILYTKGSKATALKDGRANDYSLVFYKHIRELREERSKKTPVSPTKDTSVSEKDTSVSETAEIGDMGVAPKNKSIKKQLNKTSLFTNERQSDLDSLFGRESTPETEDEAFRDFMGDLYREPGTETNTIYNNTTSEWIELESIEAQLLECGWDWSFILRDYDVEDIDNKLLPKLKSGWKIKELIQTAVSKIRWGTSTKSQELSKITAGVK